MNTSTSKNSVRVSVTARIVLVVLAAFLLVAATLFHIFINRRPPLASSERPIISQMMAEPGAYDGKRVTIYGLVIDSSTGGQRFSLQDVSQMPLTVEAPDGSRVRTGDQLLVQGIFRSGTREHVLIANEIIPTKVLGGGGCC